MKGRLRSTGNGQWEAALEGAPAYCHALPMAPSTLEPALKQGLWLVLVAAPWSIQDVRAIPLALAVAQEFGGRVELGVRPFDDHEETHVWCPAVPKFHASPLWLLFRDGHLQEQMGGERNGQEIRQMIERGLVP